MQSIQPKLVNQNQQNWHRYFWANYEQFGGNNTTAQQWYTALLTENDSAHLYKGYLHFLHAIGDYTQILSLMAKFDSVFSDDPNIQYIFVQALEKKGKQEEAEKRLFHLSNKFKTHQEIAFHTANAYIRRKELSNALNVIDTLLNNSPQKPNNFIFYFLKSQINMQLNKKDDALENVKRSLEIHPAFDKGWLLYALIEEQRGDLDNAIKGYTTFLELTGTNKQIEQHLLNLIFKQKMIRQNNPYLMVDMPCLQKALLLFEKQKYHEALQEVDQCLEQAPNDKEGRLLKIQILSSLHAYDHAITLLKKWILEDPNDEIWFSTLHLLAKSGAPSHSIRSALHVIEQHYPSSLLTILYCADFHLRIKSQNKAITYLNKALSLTTDTLLKTKILYQLSLIYYERRQFTLMHTALEQGRNFGHNFAPLLNLLAYYYAGKGNNISEAQKLISLVLHSDPKNPHFLDTQAYIFYKQKKYDQALVILHEIIQQVPHDTTIIKHLSKTLYKNNNHEQALTLLNNALQFTPHKHEKKKIKKICASWRKAHAKSSRYRICCR